MTVHIAAGLAHAAEIESVSRPLNCPGIELIPEEAGLQGLNALRESAEALRAACGGDVNFLWLLGTLERRLGQFSRASVSLERAVMLDPTRPGLLLEYALVREDLGDFASASSLYEHLLSEHHPPEIVVALIRRRLSRIKEPTSVQRNVSEFVVNDKFRLQGVAGQLNIARGFDSNLNGAPSVRELTLTTIEGPLILEIDAKDTPRAGFVWNLDGRIAGQWLIKEDRQFRLGLKVFARIGDFKAIKSEALDLNIEYRQSLPEVKATPVSQPDVRSSLIATGTLQQLRFGGVSVAQVRRLGFAREFQVIRAPSVERDVSACNWQQTLDVEELRYNERSFLDGRTLFVGGRLLCSSNVMHIDVSLKLGKDFAASLERPGGDQHRSNLAIGLATDRGPHGFRLQWHTHYSSDEFGYNPLIDNNKIRKSNRVGVALEYIFRIPETQISWVIGIGRQNQSSSIQLFSTRAWGINLGLQKTY